MIPFILTYLDKATGRVVTVNSFYASYLGSPMNTNGYRYMDLSPRFDIIGLTTIVG
jgi:hypothetical protein